MVKIILKVQPYGKVIEKCIGNYRLGISKKDSDEIFKIRGFKVFIILDNIAIELETTCGSPNTKGFDLYNKDLDIWIKENLFCDYEKGNPTKLEFEILENHTDYIKLKFVKKIANSSKNY